MLLSLQEGPPVYIHAEGRSSFSPFFSFWILESGGALFWVQQGMIDFLGDRQHELYLNPA